MEAGRPGREHTSRQDVQNLVMKHTHGRWEGINHDLASLLRQEDWGGDAGGQDGRKWDISFRRVQTGMQITVLRWHGISG